MLSEQVIAVNKNNLPLGKLSKKDALLNGVLHRAFSVFVFNKDQELLLQKRALNKQTYPGMWSICSSYPTIDENCIDAAHRRLKEEMGFDCQLIKAFDYVHESETEHNFFDKKYIEVFFGIYAGKPKINKNEASEWEYVSLELLKKMIKESPGNYSPLLYFTIIDMENFSKKNFDKSAIQDSNFNFI